MHRAQLGGRRSAVDGGREQGMRERDLAATRDRHEPRPLRRCERVRVDSAGTRTPERRCFEQRFARSCRQRSNAPGDQRAEIVRHRERRRALGATVGEQPGNLECVERVAARRLGEPDEHRPRECHAQAVDDDPLQGGDGERPDG